ncbi:MAG: ATP-binding protein [Opitutaceae bacterium]|nr:ATP-binding protein [Opitutaceae bacterium]
MSWSNQQRVYARIYWPMVLSPLAVGALVAGISGALYLRESSQSRQNLYILESSRVEMLAHILERSLQSVTSDLRVLASGDGLVAYLSSGHPVDLDRAVQRASFFSRQQNDYDQIRYLDERGAEVIRVNQNGSIASPNRLQNKSDRPYFRNAQPLNPGQVYVSAFDLNAEDGRIATPFKPIIRFSTPVFDSAGRRQGVYVINYVGAQLFTRLGQFVPLYQHRLRVLNAQGYWLKAASSVQEWGFLFPDRAGMTLARTEPALWNRILREPEGRARYGGGLLTWRRVGLLEIAAGDSGAVITADPFLVVAAEVSAEEWAATFRGLRQTFLIIAAVLLLLITAGLWMFRSRQQMLEERDRFFTLTRDMLCVAGFDGYFKRLNPAWGKTLGYTNDELLSRPFLEFVHPDDRAQTHKEAAGLAHGRETVSFENRYRCKDGSYRWLLWSSRSIVSEQLIFASARDVTERKHDEEKIQQLHTDLQRRAAQLEAANHELEAFSYSVSHDLRAPLRHIDGFTSLLEKQLAPTPDEKVRHYLRVISGAAQQMGRLIDDLLAFSRAGRMQLRPALVDQDALVATIIREGALEQGARPIQWSIAPLPRVQADPAMLRQVWFNLIDNAIKYSGKSPHPQIEISGHADAATGKLVCSIRDNGAGFDMQYVGKLFHIFQRLHGAGEFDGTGIGLANVRRIVERHGGRVWAEGRVGAGATFYFCLPDGASPPAPCSTPQPV